MPNTYQPNDDTLEVSKKIFSHAELDLPKNSFVFACFNNPNKITPEIFQIWVNIIKKVENSVLWLFATNEQTKINLHWSNSIKENIKSIFFCITI